MSHCPHRGPGGGKTTAADLYRREIGERVVVVPEAAKLLFSGGFPRSTEIHARCSAQDILATLNRGCRGGPVAPVTPGCATSRPAA